MFISQIHKLERFVERLCQQGAARELQGLKANTDIGSLLHNTNTEHHGWTNGQMASRQWPGREGQDCSARLNRVTVHLAKFSFCIHLFHVLFILIPTTTTSVGKDSRARPLLGEAGRQAQILLWTQQGVAGSRAKSLSWWDPPRT